MPTFGQRVNDIPRDSKGDILSDTRLTLYASEADATAKANPLGTTKTDKEGRWSFDHSDSVVWVSVQDGETYPLLAPESLNSTFVAVLQAKFDGSDETATLQAAVNAAAGGTLMVPKGKRIKSGKIAVPAAGITLRGFGKSSVLDLIDDGSAGSCLLEALDGSNLDIADLCIESSNATGRTSLYGLIRTRGWSGLKVKGVAFGKSPSTAVWTSTTTDFTLSDLDIQDTYADGIHISRGSKNGTIERIRGKNIGDDLVGINAYTNDGATNYDNITRVTVRDIKGQNIGTGRGVAVNGGDDIEIDGVMIDGVDQAAVLISRVTGQTYSPGSITIDNVTGRNTGRNIPSGGTSGALYVAFASAYRIGANIVGGVTIESSATGVRADRPSKTALSAGPETMDRFHALGDVTMATQTLRLTYLTAQRELTVNNVLTYASTTPAAATPTLVRIGVYDVSPTNGDLTLVASTANDTTLYASGNTEYVKALSAPLTLSPGKRYAVGVLVVTAATAPTLLGLASAATRPNVALLGRDPRLTAVRVSQSDLPASITSGLLANTTSAVYAALIP